MEHSNDQLEEVKVFVMETLEDYALSGLYSEEMVEHYYNRCPYTTNKYKIALRIADYIIFSHHVSLRNAAL